jgi:effector-binding domain-containing protein
MAKYKPSTLPSRKILILAAIGLVAAVGGGATVMLFLGAFKTPDVYRDVTENYRIAYLLHTGSYSNIKPVLEQVAEHLKKGGIEPTTPCALYLDDVSKVPEAKLRSKVGYLVKRSDYLPAPLEEMELASREVVTATFEGGTLLGSHKVYSAMREWARSNGYRLAPPNFEIYHPNGKVEYQVPIHKR